MANQSSTEEKVLLPWEPIHVITKPLSRFLHIEAVSGVFLLLCAVIALAVANSPLSEAYLGFWKMSVGFTVAEYELTHSLKHWINDGLMAIFFFVIGLEVKRELVLGQLRELRSAALPLVAALGGMLVPAGIYLLFQWNQLGQRGWGIPMATDIAFVVGCMAVLGRRVPGPLRVMLLSLAIVDDIGAILVIAIGYTDTIHWPWLLLGAIGTALVFFLQRFGVRSIGMYIMIGSLIWVGFHESGVHATIAGVILGLMTPARPYLASSLGGHLLAQASEVLHEGSWEQQSHRSAKVRQYRRVARETISPLEYLIYTLHPWVAFFIMPLFALANAGVPFETSDVVAPVSVAVLGGLVIGKPLGILLFCWLSTKIGVAHRPAGVSWIQIIGGGFLAGIGFTMALFISDLAFRQEVFLRQAKVGVLVASLIAAVVGVLILLLASRSPKAK